MKAKQIIKALKKYDPDSRVQISFRKNANHFVYLTVDKIDHYDAPMSNGEVMSTILLESIEDMNNLPHKHFIINGKIFRLYQGGNNGKD